MHALPVSRDIVFQVSRHVTVLEDHWDSLCLLADQAEFDNPFFSPWFLLPAWRWLRRGGEELVLGRDASSGAPVLFFPRLRSDFFPGGRIWRHLFCYLATPLVAPGVAGLVSANPCMLGHELGLALLSGEYLDQHYLDELDSALVLRRGSFARRVLHRHSVGAKMAREVLLRADRQKDLRRKERQFQLKGGGDFEVLTHETNLPVWIEDFLRLEAAGWKGRQGSALASNPLHAHFFRDLCYEASRNGRLFFSRLRATQGRTVAIRCGILGQHTHFAYKVAFDEDWAAASPGLLLELASIDSIFADTRAVTIDSCAAPGSVLFDRLYPDTRPCMAALMRDHRTIGRAAFGAYKLRRIVGSKFPQFIYTPR